MKNTEYIYIYVGLYLYTGPYIYIKAYTIQYYCSSQKTGFGLVDYYVLLPNYKQLWVAGFELFQSSQIG